MITKHVTYFYFQSGEWCIDIPGHLIVKRPTYAGLLDKWKYMVPSIDERGYYSPSSAIVETPTKMDDLTKRGT